MNKSSKPPTRSGQLVTHVETGTMRRARTIFPDAVVTQEGKNGDGKWDTDPPEDLKVVDPAAEGDIGNVA